MRLKKQVSKGRKELILAWAIAPMQADMHAHGVISVRGHSIEYTEEEWPLRLLKET